MRPIPPGEINRSDSSRSSSSITRSAIVGAPSVAQPQAPVKTLVRPRLAKPVTFRHGRHDLRPCRPWRPVARLEAGAKQREAAMNWTVRNVMTTEVIRVERDTPFAAIAAALRQYRVSAFPVVDEDSRVIGVVSESDLLNKMVLGGGEDHMPGLISGIVRHKQLEKARGVTAADLMTAPPVTVSPDDTVEHAARLMYLRGVKRLPVVDADGKLAGIVSRADVLTVYGRPDAEIGEDIRISVLSTEGAANPGAFDVSVTEGVVT